MSKVTRSTPYVAQGSPTSPMVLAVAGLLVAVGSQVAARYDLEIPADAITVATVAAVLAGLWGIMQALLARREQVSGATVLKAALAAEPRATDLADLAAAVARLRGATDERGVEKGGPS